MEKYKDFVIKNVDTLGMLETSARTMLFFLPGRVRDSEIKLELAYALTGLVSTFHDGLVLEYFEKHRPNRPIAAQGSNFREEDVIPPAECVSAAKKIAFLHNIELLAELFSEKTWGERGKWIVVAIIETAKALLKMRILIAMRGRMLINHIHCSIPQLRSYTEVIDIIKQKSSQQSPQQRSPKYRSQLASPSKWQQFKFQTQDSAEYTSHQLPSFYSRRAPISCAVAETLHIFRPLIYLFSMLIFGKRSWKALIASLLVDMSSIFRHSKNLQLMNSQEKDELMRRFGLLLYYFLRSPLYEAFTGSRAVQFIGKKLQFLPFFSTASEVAGEYINVYRDHYFYTSGTQ
eukprot:TRINITY_DN7325_c0_g1_i1.p1 TRINITY_DN7325_c0_g1~~TRINITY_DN7325_c0_g1_i1.p1  ORF type:complete len:346 (-),score=69.56 TRINITY_DN7325_c0_g1_i1:10-1047(-)